MNNDKTLYAVDQLLDTVNDLRRDLAQARTEAENWRNVSFVDSTTSPEEFRRHIRGNPLPWENERAE